MRATIIYLFFVLFILISCNKEPYDYENNRTSYFKNINEQSYNDSIIICVTYNIHLGFKAIQDPWEKEEIGANKAQIQNIADVLKQINPDIIALQEVPRNRYNAEVKNFLEELAAKLNMNYAFGAHGYNDPYGIYPVYGEWGTAILTKYKILNINNIEVEYVDKWQKRSILDAKIEINNSTTLHTMTLHYLPIQEGIPNTAHYLKQINEPVILLGDFNYTGEINEFKEIGLNDVDSTYEKNWIDRIFYSKSYFKNIEFGSLIDSLWVSDHSANYGIIKIKNNTTNN